MSKLRDLHAKLPLSLRLLLSSLIGAMAFVGVSEGIRFVIGPAHAAAAAPSTSVPSPSVGPGSIGSGTHSGGSETVNNNSGPCSGTTGGKPDCSKHEEKLEALPPSFQRITLTPAHEDVAETWCSKKQSGGSFRIIMGKFEVFMDHSPLNILLMKEKPIIKVAERDHKLDIEQLLLFDEEYKNIVDIDNNSVWISPEYEGKLIGHSGFLVYDHDHNIMFKIMYFNKRTIEIWGTFRIKEDPVTVIADDTIHIQYPNGEDSGPMTGCADHLSYAAFSF